MEFQCFTDLTNILLLLQFPCTTLLDIIHLKKNKEANVQFNLSTTYYIDKLFYFWIIGLWNDIYAEERLVAVFSLKFVWSSVSTSYILN